MSTHHHLSLDQRALIQTQLVAHASFQAIASLLDKDPTTIAKEIKKQRIERAIGYHNCTHNDCVHRITCTHRFVCSPCSRGRPRLCKLCGLCNQACPDFIKDVCPKLQKPPYVCNGCSKRHNCALTKWLYDAHVAHTQYRQRWSEARKGLCISEAEIKQLDELISPLLKKRQSIHHIVKHNPDLIPWSERTLYTYVDQNLFQARNLDLARKIRMSPRKKSKTLKIERACRVGRTYLDYQAFLLANDHPAVVQMDTVEGLKGGSNILTLFFETSGLMLAFKRSCNNALSVITLMNDLYQRLGHTTYTRLFGVLLCDNGSEFSHPSALEFAPEGHRRSHLFYCDPGAPYQKGGCERNHEFIRMILPKGSDFEPWTQDDFNLILDHINAYPRKRLNDRSPANLFSQLESPQLLAILGVSFIAPNAINLTPSLLRK